MRAHQDLVELRDADLSFSVEETRGFLHGFGVRLDEPELALVHSRSEGWVAGLQMAALSIQGSPDQATAAGRVQLYRHTVAGYFLEEVLSRQPPEVAEFMLATSILDELSVAACTAVWGQGSAKMLEFLYGAHMFVAIVDDQARTYRYHHLIREVLRTELHAQDQARERQLHEAAARYLIEAGQTSAAARHLLAAGQEAAAFSLLSEGVVRDVLTNPTVGSALDIDEIRPGAVRRRTRVLVAVGGGAALAGGIRTRFAGCRARPADQYRPRQATGVGRADGPGEHAALHVHRPV